MESQQDSIINQVKSISDHLSKSELKLLKQSVSTLIDAELEYRLGDNMDVETRCRVLGLYFSKNTQVEISKNTGLSSSRIGIIFEDFVRAFVRKTHLSQDDELYCEKLKRLRGRKFRDDEENRLREFLTIYLS